MLSSPAAVTATIAGTLAPATRRAVIIAGCATGAAAIGSMAVMPVARHIGPALAGFVPAYQMAVFLIYFLSALHLFAHASRTGAKPLLHIAAGCLFSASVLLIQMFSFPIWGPTQLVGSSPVTTSWMWVFWHLGPPLFTLSYVAMLRPGLLVGTGASKPMLPSILIAVGSAIALAAIATGLSTWGLPWLPTVANGDNYDRMLSSGVGPFVVSVSLCALGLLVWRTRCGTIIELCLGVSLAMLVLDDLPTLVGGSRLSVGWYFGRLEAFVSACVLLGFYLIECDRRIAVATELARALSDQRSALDRALQEQAKANVMLRTLAREDSLTRVANRRRLDETLDTEWHRARRDQSSLALLMIDVDHFKRFNDSFGHQAGDVCLREIATLIREVAQRPSDLAARYGGEEFAVLLPGATAQQGRYVAERLREIVSRHQIIHGGLDCGRVSVSIGVASVIPAFGDGNYEALIELADQVLYDAKKRGRNCVVVSQGADAPVPVEAVA